MKTIFDPADYDSLVERIVKLDPRAKRLWGRMTINEMIVHLSDPLRDMLGTRITQPVTPPELWPKLIAKVLTESDWAHNQRTFSPYLQEEGGGGTRPKGFEEDRTTLLQLVSKFYKTIPDFVPHPHAGLGMLTREQAGLYIWKHIDHHLRQFDS
jgi:hypothetical protein